MYLMYVYIVRCADGSYYTGSTRGTLEHRVDQHNTGHYGGYTAKRRPVELVWHQEFQRITEGIEIERRLKGWSKAKKEALIRGEIDALRALSQRRQAFPKKKP
jgi:putative endonuclease